MKADLKMILDWCAAVAFGLALLAASAMNLNVLAARVGVLPYWHDKLLHAASYCILTVLACRAAAGRRAAALNHLAAGVAAAVGYGALVEGLQASLPGRTCSIVDIGANAAGSAIGGLAWFAAAHNSSRERQTLDAG